MQFKITFLIVTSPLHIFKGILNEKEFIDISICNPPFYSSSEEAAAEAAKKRKNLKIKSSKLNFGGKDSELWCLGGEVNFILRMIQESKEVQNNCRFFSSLVSKADSLPPIYKELKKVKAKEIRTIDMAQGQKRSRLVAWTF